MDDLKLLKSRAAQQVQQNPSANHQRQFVTEHTSCAMCDTRLEIHHEINTNDLKVKEEAYCPSCGIRVRSAHHLMH